MNKGFFRKKQRTIQIGPEGEETVLTGRAVKSECLGGCRLSGFSRLHDSKEAALYCNKLKVLQKYGEFKFYAAEVAFQLRDRLGVWVGSHKVDFLLEGMKDGREKVVREYKGLRFADFELRRGLFTWTYPEIDYEVVTWRDLT